jgi:hypothetical protein
MDCNGTIFLNQKGQVLPENCKGNHLYFVGEDVIHPGEWYVLHQKTLHFNNTDDIVFNNNAKKVYYSTNSEINSYKIDLRSIELNLDTFDSIDLPAEVLTTCIGHIVTFNTVAMYIDRNHVIELIHKVLDSNEVFMNKNRTHENSSIDQAGLKSWIHNNF